MARQGGGRWQQSDLDRVLSQKSGGKTKLATPSRYSGSSLVIPFIQQPNNYTCGPTCIAILSSALRAPSRKLPVSVIGEFAGTNPRTGTTEVEMARGLTFAGLAWRRGSARSLEELQRELFRNNLIALRTGINGSKHWVVVDRYHSDTRSFSVMCPTSGPTTWSDEQLLTRWACRDFDHFVVPGMPIAHQPQIRPIHEMTLQDFTRNGSVVREQDYRGAEQNMIDRAAEFVRGAVADPLHELRTRFHGWTFFRVLNGEPVGMLDLLGVHESAPGRPMAAIRGGVSYVDPELRGTGGGVGLILASHNDTPHRYTCPSHFSEAGYATRVRAHALAIHMAQERGLEVSAAVVDSNPLLNPDKGHRPRYWNPGRNSPWSSTVGQGSLALSAPPVAKPVPPMTPGPTLDLFEQGPR